MMNKICLLIFICSSIYISAQECTLQDRQVFAEKMKVFSDALYSTMDNNSLIGKIGRSFLNTQYTAHTLETPGDEHLIVSLTNLDCTTYLETVFAVTQSVKQHDTTFVNFAKNLSYLRYRDGIMHEYPSRLHYFSDWINNNIKKGLIEDRTKELGGKPITFSVNFMTTHPESYKQLQNNPDFIKTVAQQETAINARQYYYIPKANVAAMEDKIDEGDFIAITTNIKGMDVGHVGIAVKVNKQTKFLHAPLAGSFVQITKENLSEYLQGKNKHTGIIVFKMK